MYGKMYVRGHDREGRPIIHYRPGLEKSFDTEKVHTEIYVFSYWNWNKAFFAGVGRILRAFCVLGAVGRRRETVR